MICTRQLGETNLDDEGELTQKCTRNRFEIGQVMAFGLGRGHAGHVRGLWPWNGRKKIASGGKREYIGSQPKGKTEIPAIIFQLAIDQNNQLASVDFNGAAAVETSKFRSMGLVSVRSEAR